MVVGHIVLCSGTGSFCWRLLNGVFKGLECFCYVLDICVFFSSICIEKPYYWSRQYLWLILWPSLQRLCLINWSIWGMQRSLYSSTMFSSLLPDTILTHWSWIFWMVLSCAALTMLPHTKRPYIRCKCMSRNYTFLQQCTFRNFLPSVRSLLILLSLLITWLMWLWQESMLFAYIPKNLVQFTTGSSCPSTFRQKWLLSSQNFIATVFC